MFSKKGIEKIDKYLHATFPQIYEFNFDGIVLLYGGAIKNIIMNEKVKDLDFLILGDGNDKILEFIDYNKFKFRLNALQGYKIITNIEVDICARYDLHEVGRYSADLLFYDINRKQLLSFSFTNSVNKKTIFDYYYFEQALSQTIDHEKKVKRYIKYFGKGNCHIKRYYFKAYKLIVKKVKNYFVKK